VKGIEVIIMDERYLIIIPSLEPGALLSLVGHDRYNLYPFVKEDHLYGE
jgi:hypothetical protein